MKVGICDAMFARVDMFTIAREAIGESGEEASVERYTVPGVKDLPVAAKILFEKYRCDIVLALGMPGAQPIDKMCSHEASLGLQHVQLMVSKHILEIFVHLDEAQDDLDLLELTRRRVRDHAKNALSLLKGKQALSPLAGKGIRQGRKNAGGIE